MQEPSPVYEVPVTWLWPLCPTHVIQVLTMVVDRQCIFCNPSAPFHVGQYVWKYSFEIRYKEQAALQSQV